MGGTGAVSQSVENSINSMGISTYRIAGDSRQATSLEAMRELYKLGSFDTVVIATGTNYPDALSIGPWCYAKTAPMLLTGKNGLSSDQISQLRKYSSVKRIIILGGVNAVPASVQTELKGYGYDMTRLSGDDRYKTAAAVATFEMDEGLGLTNAVVATGANFPDALAGAPLCGANNSVMLLVSPYKASLADLILTEKNASQVDHGYVLGGENAVTKETFEYLKELTN